MFSLVNRAKVLIVTVLISLSYSISVVAVNRDIVFPESDVSNPAMQSPQKKPVFHHLTIDDGLSHNSVFHVLQNRQGFIWMTTVEGINRYDGMTMTTFMPQAEGSKSTVQFYYTMLEGRDGILWVSTYATDY
jgi:ligand-binding sensor domain-containing protein